MSDYSRFQPGGSAYKIVLDSQGKSAADTLAEAAFWGDEDTIASIMGFTAGGALNTAGTSTLGNFWNQITTDPFAAPLESANNQAGKFWKNLFTSPWVLVTLALVIFYLVGGFDWVKKKIANA